MSLSRKVFGALPFPGAKITYKAELSIIPLEMSTFDDLPYEIVNHLIGFVECESVEEYKAYCLVNKLFYNLFRGKRMVLTRNSWKGILEEPWHEKFLVGKTIESFSDYKRMMFTLHIEFLYYHAMYVFTALMVVIVRHFLFLFAIPLFLYYVIKYSLYPLDFIDLIPIYLFFTSLLILYCCLVVSKFGSYFTSLFLQRESSFSIMFEKGQIWEGFLFNSVLFSILCVAFYFIWHQWIAMRILCNNTLSWLPFRIFFPLSWIATWILANYTDYDLPPRLSAVINHPLFSKIYFTVYLFFIFMFGIFCDRMLFIDDLDEDIVLILRIILLFISIPASIHWEYLSGCLDFQRPFRNISVVRRFLHSWLYFFIKFQNFRLNFVESKFEFLYHIPFYCIISYLCGAHLIIVMIPVLISLFVGLIQVIGITRKNFGPGGVFWEDVKFSIDIMRDRKVCLFGYRDWLYYCFGKEELWRICDKERTEYVERLKKEHNIEIRDDGFLPEPF